MFENEDFARDYDQRLSEEGYPGNIFNIINSELRGCKTVVDIGAGTGFFSIPLCVSGYDVFAVEPSQAMAKILVNKCKMKKLNIDLTVNDWDSWSGQKMDAAISIHSVYGFSDLRKSILKMTECASKRIILVKTDKSQTFTKAVRKGLAKTEKHRNISTVITEILDDNDFIYSLREMSQQRDYLCKSLFSEAEWFQNHYELGDFTLDDIKKVIEAVTVFQHGRRIYKSVYVDHLIVW